MSRIPVEAVNMEGGSNRKTGDLISCRSALMTSDMHCKKGSKCPQLEAIARTASKLGTECLVVAGDLFDDFHEEADAELFFKEFGKICSIESLPAKTIIVLSGSSHDPILDKLFVKTTSGKTLLVTRQITPLYTPKGKVVVIHGDIIIRSGALAFIINYLAKILGQNLFLERKFREKIRLESGWLVAGHTHIYGVDAKEKIVNLGSWKKHWFKNLPYWRRSKPVVLVIGEKGLKLHVVDYL